MNEKERIRFEKLVRKFQLPLKTDFKKELLIDALKKDKKMHSQKIDFIVIEKIGTSKIIPIYIKDLISFL